MANQVMEQANYTAITLYVGPNKTSELRAEPFLQQHPTDNEIWTTLALDIVNVDQLMNESVSPLPM